MRTLLVAVIAAFARYAAAEEVLIQLKGTVTGVEEGFAPWPVKVGDTVRAQYTYSLPAPADQYDEPERGYYSFPNARFNVDAGALVFGQRDLYIYVQDYPAADQHVVASEAHLGDVVRRIQWDTNDWEGANIITGEAIPDVPPLYWRSYLVVLDYDSTNGAVLGKLEVHVEEIVRGVPPVAPVIPYGNRDFSATGTNQTFVVPAGVTELTVDMWGAGGELGSADLGGADCEYMPGGGGGYVNARIPVTPGETLWIRVGTAPLALTDGGWPNGGDGWLDQIKVGRRYYVFGMYGGAGGSSSIMRGSEVLAEAGGGNGGLPCMAPLGGGVPRSCTPFGNQRGTDLVSGYEAGGGGWCGGASSQPSASGVASGVSWSYEPANGQTAGAVEHIAREGAGEGGFLYSAKPGRVIISWAASVAAPVASNLDCGDMVETDIGSRWSYYQQPGTLPNGSPFATTLSELGAADSFRGQHALRANTTAAFDFALIYSAPEPINASGYEQLRFAIRALNTNILVGATPWQGNYPVVVLEDANGARRTYFPQTNLMPRDGTTWVPITVPLAGGSGWSLSGGSIDFTRITSIEVHSDTWEWNPLVIDIDAMSFEHPQTVCVDLPTEVTISAATPVLVGSIVPWGPTGALHLACTWTLQTINNSSHTALFTGVVGGTTTTANTTWTGTCGQDGGDPCGPPWQLLPGQSVIYDGWYGQWAVPKDGQGNYLAPIPFTQTWTHHYSLVGDPPGTDRIASMPILTCLPPPTATGVYTITVTQTPNGMIGGYTFSEFAAGADQTYSITPNAGYRVADVIVDGNSVGAVSSYTFTDIRADHTITAAFEMAQVPQALCGPGPSIVFYAPGQTCQSFWMPDATGMPATLSFESTNVATVSVSGTPLTLPPGYLGPYPPASEYIGTFIAGSMGGIAQVRVLATHPDGSSQYYSTWTINAYY